VRFVAAATIPSVWELRGSFLLAAS
jgi:hypothetical protein